VQIQYGLPGYGHCGEMRQCMLCDVSVLILGDRCGCITYLSWFSSWERSVLTGLAAGTLLMAGMVMCVESDLSVYFCDRKRSFQRCSIR
jgi:hypothetical protein